MGQKGKGFDQRKSYRCPVAESQQTAELRVRRRRYAVRLYNESSGGFAALADRDPRVVAGDVVRLFTAAGGFEVRVAHVSRIEPAARGGQDAPPVFRIGLERLRDLAFSPDDQAAPGSLLVSLGRRMLRPSGTLVVVGLTMLIVGVMMGAMTVLNRPHKRHRQQTFHAAQEGQQQSPGSEQTPAQIIQGLGLSKPQQAQLQDVAQRTAQSLREIDTLWKNDVPEERARKQALLLEAAKREILNMLSGEQRARWQSLWETHDSPR